MLKFYKSFWLLINGVYLYSDNNNIKTETMRYLHQVLDSEGNQIELIYSNNNNSKFSCECLAKIKNGTYQIFDRENN